MELVALNFDTKINDRLRSNTKVFGLLGKEIVLVLKQQCKQSLAH
jgi:hypothetical protein